MPRRKRCPNGTRRNLSTNTCQRKSRRTRSNSKRTRYCPRGSRRIPPKTGSCVHYKKRRSKSKTRTLSLPSRGSSLRSSKHSSKRSRRRSSKRSRRRTKRRSRR